MFWEITGKGEWNEGRTKSNEWIDGSELQGNEREWKNNGEYGNE